MKLMFKKIEIWILYLVIILFFPLTTIFGILVRQELVGTVKGGKLSQTALFLAEIPKNIKIMFKNNLLIGDFYPTLNGFNGTPNNKESYLLLSRYDGNLKTAVVELVDLTTFQVLHKWNPNLNRFNNQIQKVDEFKYLNRDKNNSRGLLKHPILLNDRGLVFLDQDAPIRKIDSCSNLLFQNTSDLFHHSIEKDIDGNLWAPNHIYPQSIPGDLVKRVIPQDGGYRDDGIVKLSPNGTILFQKSVSQILIDNGFRYLLFGQGKQKNDPIHLNDIQPVDFDGPFWKKGDVFLSLRDLSLIILYRPSTNKIIKTINGPFLSQHDVDILDENRIAVFNNKMLRTYKGIKIDGNNEVNIYNFKTKEFSSYLKNSLIDNNISTHTEGRSEILSNGDLFLEESNRARTIYFNSDGTLRWQHYNRAADGKVYRLGWSRILHSAQDITIVKNFLNSKNKCND